MAENSKNGPSLDEPKKGTRVFKKTCPNGKVTTYLGKRDFLNHLKHVDPIDGVVLLDKEYLNGRKVFAHVLAAFRYGREDLDVLGLTFRKDLYMSQQQIYPPLEGDKRPLTRLQERLINKLGDHAFPFYFELPPTTAPASVTLQPAPGDTGKPCGIDYELKTYVADSVDEKLHKRNSVRLAIRLLTYLPNIPPKPQPSAETSKEFMMSQNPLHLEASLDKELYYHGEPISVNVSICNNSNKTVKKIKLSDEGIRQLYRRDRQTFKAIDPLKEVGFPVGQSSNLSKVYTLTPLLQPNKDKRGLALDGKLKHEDTNLASSTNLVEGVHKENLGIIVQYRVKIKLVVSFGGDVVLELPFTLTHPYSEEDQKRLTLEEAGNVEQDPVSTDHITIDTTAGDAVRYDDEDFIFEDFARMRLKGYEGEDTGA